MMIMMQFDQTENIKASITGLKHSNLLSVGDVDQQHIHPLTGAIEIVSSRAAATTVPTAGYGIKVKLRGQVQWEALTSRALRLGGRRTNNDPRAGTPVEPNDLD